MASNNVRFQNDGTEDETMEDDTTIPATIGGRDLIIKAICELLVKGILNPMELSDKQIRTVEEARHIKKATLKPQLSNLAERIAAIVNTESPTTTATLRSLVHEETANNTSQMELGIKWMIIAYSRPRNLRDLLREAKLYQKRQESFYSFLGVSAIIC